MWAYATLHEVTRDNATSALLHPEGVAVTSPQRVSMAERFLVVHSGKVLDGIHTSFNRRLCRPFARVLSHTSAGPNAVTWGGVVISILSAVAFAQGSYWWPVLGEARHSKCTGPGWFSRCCAYRSPGYDSRTSSP